MRISRAAGCAALFGLVLVLAGCNTKLEDPTLEVAERLGTHKPTPSMYHELARHPHGLAFMHEGFIVAVEKSPRGSIEAGQGMDARLLNRKSEYFADDKREPIEGRGHHFDDLMDEPKAMFVSHVLAFEPDVSHNPSPRRMTPRFLYNLYPDAGAENKPDDRCLNDGDPKPKPYIGTWHALEILDCELRLKLDAAEARGLPYTHLIVASMGWDNDQVESVRRYNAIMGNLMRVARDKGDKTFNPLLIGFTWPSVWGIDTIFDIWQLASKLWSYGNKSDDADEIGYVIANKLVNDTVLKIRRDYRGGKDAAGNDGLKVVLIGHSMGARLLTRAVFSRKILLGWEELSDQHVDLVLGLQGAYSVNRYINGHSLRFPFSLFHPGEGYPYAEYADFPGTLVMTWSEEDDANPIAAFLTGSGHIGGKTGHKMSRDKAKTDLIDPFHQLKWVKPNKTRKGWQDAENEDAPADRTCPQIKSMNANDPRVLLVDSTSFVKGHNDILDFEMGQFIWASIDCFAG